MLRKIQGVWNYLRVFSTIQDIRKFRLVAYGNGSEPVVVNVRAAGRIPLHIRPHTTDAWLLWETFFNQYHLPSPMLRPDAIIFDLGANVGYATVHFARLYPRATILAVELDERNCTIANIHLKPIKRCKLINAAVWSEDGSVSYDSGDGGVGFHVDNDCKNADATTAVAKTISTIMAENNVTSVDFILMDIEGAEWPVLSTGTDWLERVKKLKVELHPMLNKNATYENCARVLTSRGFTCSRPHIHWNVLDAVRN